MWETTIDGRTLHFHLAGINNQNFIMRDEETGSWWQQVTGEAILGPLKGKRLKEVQHDEVSFGIWKTEKPEGRVLVPDEKIVAAKEYAPANWEERMTRVPVVTPINSEQPLEARALVIGITLNKVSKAYPFSALQKQSPLIDTIGGVPILIVVGQDNRSVRAYERNVDGRRLEFFKKAEDSALQLVDAETGSAWDFAGRATSGPLTGKQLEKVSLLEDYWFDWQIYHPNTSIYHIGEESHLP